MITTFDIVQPTLLRPRPDWPVDIGIAGDCILGYIFAWIGLIGYFHPSHWVAGLIGAVVGSFVGWVWFKLVMKNGSK